MVLPYVPLDLLELSGSSLISPIRGAVRQGKLRTVADALQTRWLEPVLAALVLGIGIADAPEQPWEWITIGLFAIGAGVSGTSSVAGAGIVGLGLVTSAFLPADQVSGAGLALFVPIFALVRRSSRYAALITVALVALGFYVMVIHASGGRSLSGSAAAILPTLLALSVGSGLIMRASREQLEAERLRSEERLAELRLDLARELHDNAVHKISQAAMRAHMAAMRPDTSPDLADEFTQIATSCNDAAHELRLLLSGLRQTDPSLGAGQPQIIDADALAALIEGQADRLAAVGFTVTQDVNIDAPTSLQSRTLAAIAVEAVNNIVQHAPAKSDCVIRVFPHDGALCAEFTNHTRNSKQSTSRPSFGLLGIEERARAAGGFITISKPAGYWRFEVTLPPVPAVVPSPELDMVDQPRAARRAAPSADLLRGHPQSEDDYQI